MIPAVLCYSNEKEDWLIGEEAMLYAEQTGAWLFRDLFNNMLLEGHVMINDIRYTYDRLVAVFFGKLLELIQIHSGLMSIEGINVTMRKVTIEAKEAVESVFNLLKVEPSKVRLLSYAESFAYYVLNEDEQLWKDGALLYDFDNEGFFSKQLTVAGDEDSPIFYVNEKMHSGDFHTKDLASELLRSDLDLKLTELFEEIRFGGPRCSVFFTGTGFSELWFSGTLEKISRVCRVFKGNNLYVKGACLAGYLKAAGERSDYPIICRGRTRASISVKMRYKGQLREMELSAAACDWYDAGVICDFILDDEKSACFVVTSLVSRQRSEIIFDLSSFPDRPVKATRVQVTVKYLSEHECEIRVADAGFGAFFEASGAEVVKRIDLEGYI